MQQNVTSDNATRANEPLGSDLEEYQRQIEAINEDARDLLTGLSEVQVNWRPTPAHWSIAECLDHLTVTNRELMKQIEAGMSDARARGLTSRGPFRYGIIGNMIVRSMEPPAKLKFKAPKIFKPRPDQSLEMVTKDFFAAQDELLRLINEANGINLARVKIASPVTTLIKLSLGQAFGLIATHERRHLWQARQVKGNQTFPAPLAAI
jgi:DinB superfamily